ncbi:MAG: hypothetical protein EBY07_17240 [Actinobacteria bacterium]|nr:hypothetical protein [Actinomycetota bacterium]
MLVQHSAQLVVRLLANLQALRLVNLQVVLQDLCQKLAEQLVRFQSLAVLLRLLLVKRSKVVLDQCLLVANLKKAPKQLVWDQS